MLIYNFQKEFIGIDETDLEVFGFHNLSELKTEASDFADLFIRTPGYIHNFKHVHWIDFVTCADPSEESKVIIEVNSKTYKATLNIETLYLSDNPTSKAYIVNLNNLKALTLKENGEFSEDLARVKPKKIEPAVGLAFGIPEEAEAEVETKVAPEPENFRAFDDIEDVEKLDVEHEVKPVIPIDISFDDDEIDESPQAPEVEESFLEEAIELDNIELRDDTVQEQEALLEEDDDFDYSYNYDPQVASDELGLPIDLIEEFIQDFIAQAKEFRDELYSSLNEDDMNNVKVLSHKLKGVAANLRVEDAFNTLSVINTSPDTSEVGKYLNIFYKIIAKLSGEEIATTVQTAAEPIQKEEKYEQEIKPVELEEENQEEESDLYEDDFIIDFKEVNSNDLSKEEATDLNKLEELNQETETSQENQDDDLYLDFDVGIKDSQVPQKIEMPELADDDFLNNPTEDVNDLLSTDEELKLDIEEPDELLDIVYSKELVANEIGLDQESFDEIFEDYIQDSKSISTTIRQAISAENYNKCQSEALKLRGMSENMRVNTFKEELQSLIGSSDRDELIQAITKIDAIIAKISK